MPFPRAKNAGKWNMVSGVPATVRHAHAFVANINDLVDQTYDAATNAVRTAAQERAAKDPEWSRYTQHIDAWVEPGEHKDHIVVGLPAGHPESAKAFDLEYGSDETGPKPVLRGSLLHQVDAVGREASRHLVWP